MGFAAEMDDFVKGWDAVDKWKTSAVHRGYYRALTEKNMPAPDNPNAPGMPQPGGMPGIPEEEGQPNTDPGKTGSRTMENVGGGRIDQHMYNYYRTQWKLGHIPAASIVGNLMRESGGDPRVFSGARTGDAGASYYAGQWNGIRRTNIESFAADRGHGKPTLQDQLDFVIEEMNPNSKYVDKMAAAMFPKLQAATDLSQGVKLFQMGFERPGDPEGDFAPRLKYAQALGEGGGDTGDSFSFDQGTGTASTEPAKKAAAAEEAPAAEQTAEAEPESMSANISFDLPEVAIPEITAQFVPPPESDYLDTLAQQQQIATGGPSPWLNAQSLPVTQAQEGGVIPEPAQLFAAGGVAQPTPVVNKANPSAVKGVDKYSSTRTYTQPVAATPKSTFTPHRVGYLGLPGPSAAPKVSSSQQEFRNVRAKSAAADKAAADAKAKAVADAAAKAAADAAAKAAADAAARNRRTNQNRWGYRTLGDTSGRGGHDSGGYSTSGREGAGGFGSRSSSAGWGGGWGGGPGKAGGLYQEGGMIPDIGEDTQNFAQGGGVAVAEVDPVFWKKVQRKYQGTSTRAEEAGQSARDRAAREVTHGRSTAIRVGEGGAEAPRPGKAATKGGKKATEKAGKKAAAKKEEKVPTPTPRPEPELRKAAGTPTEPYEPKPALRQAAGTPTEGYEPKPALRQAAGTPTEGYEPIPEPVPPIVAPAEAAPGEPAPAIPEPEQTPEQRRPQIVVPDTTLPPGSTAVPAPPAPDTGPLIPTAEVPTREFQEPLGAREVAEEPPPFPVPESPRPEQGPPAPPPDIYAAVRDARLMLSQGRDPHDVAVMLRSKGIAEYLWPQDIKEKIMDFGFARGGAVPEEDERFQRPMTDRAESAGYTTSAPGAPSISSARQPEASPEPARAVAQAPEPPPQRDRYQATPELMDAVKAAAKGGARFIGRHFGIDTGGGEEAIPTPEGAAQQEQGATRFAQGEGAATPEEIQQIDARIGVPQDMLEGDKNMERMARMMNWYLQRGRKDDAEAAAASLMMYGANRVSQLGNLAAVAYQKGDIDRTIQFLEQAYTMIPDGGALDVTIDRKTGKFIATHTDADGDETKHVVTPQELPGLIQQVQSKSVFWQSISRLGDPEGAKSRDIEARTIREEQRQTAAERAKTKEQRTYTEGYEEYKHGRSQEEELSKEERAAQREADKEARAAKATEEKEARANAEADRRRMRDEALVRDRWDKDPAHKGTDWDTVSPLWSTAKKALDAYRNDKSPENQTAVDEAASRLFDALPSKDRAKDMMDLGFYPDDFTYNPSQIAPEVVPETQAPPPVAGAEAAPAAAAPAPPAGKPLPRSGTTPPPAYPTAKPGNDQAGNPIWVIEQGGKKFAVPGP